MHLTQLLADDDIMACVLANFSFDYSKELRKVCRRWQAACYARLDDDVIVSVQWQPFHHLDAALHRLRRRYDLDVDKLWFEPVEQIVRALYWLCDQKMIVFDVPLPHHHLERMNVLGLTGMIIINPAAFIHKLITTVLVHPAFARVEAGPYRYVEHNAPCVVRAILRDLGLRPASNTQPPPFLLPQHQGLHHLYWLGDALRNTHAALIDRLREYRAEAIAARRRRKLVALRLRRLARQLA